MRAADPTRARKAIRAQTVAAVAGVMQAVLLVVSIVGLLAKLGVIGQRWAVLAPIGVVVGLAAFIVSLLAGKLAERYREPAAADEVP